MFGLMLSDTACSHTTRSTAHRSVWLVPTAMMLAQKQKGIGTAQKQKGIGVAQKQKGNVAEERRDLKVNIHGG